MRFPKIVASGLMVIAAVLLGGLAQAECDGWPQWDTFKRNFVSEDGRVIDHSHADQRTVSEGQAYALLFALIANDRSAFDSLLNWTQNNLADGDLAARLPAWLWGIRVDPKTEASEQKTWGIIDRNPAADADVWIAYALIEAGRLWQSGDYTTLGEQMLSRILDQEVMNLPGLGPVLMPAPHGFVETPGRYRLNPSYQALQPLRRFFEHSGNATWQQILSGARRVLHEGAPLGLAGDWLLWKPTEGGFQADERSVAAGSYDAIRVYLWIGMLHPQDSDRAALLQRYAPIQKRLDGRGRPPEFVDIRSAKTRGIGPSGFSAALMPFFAASGAASALLQQRFHLSLTSAGEREGYYDSVLKLFGEGWIEGRYRFGPQGALWPRWTRLCHQNEESFASAAPAR